MGPGVSSSLFSAAMKRESVRICQAAGGAPKGVAWSATTVPWLGVPNMTRSSTLVRRLGHHRTAQRGSRPPWLWPSTSALDPLRS
jgi:hypothetical protein